MLDTHIDDAFALAVALSSLKFQVMGVTLFSQGTLLTSALTLLYHQWTASTRYPTPTLFDAMAVASVIDAGLCPSQPMRIAIDDKGCTRVEQVKLNANACLPSDADLFFHVYIPAVLSGRSSQDR